MSYRNLPRSDRELFEDILRRLDDLERAKVPVIQVDGQTYYVHPRTGDLTCLQHCLACDPCEEVPVEPEPEPEEPTGDAPEAFTLNWAVGSSSGVGDASYDQAVGNDMPFPFHAREGTDFENSWVFYGYQILSAEPHTVDYVQMNGLTGATWSGGAPDAAASLPADLPNYDQMWLESDQAAVNAGPVPSGGGIPPFHVHIDSDPTALTETDAKFMHLEDLTEIMDQSLDASSASVTPGTRYNFPPMVSPGEGWVMVWLIHGRTTFTGFPPPAPEYTVGATLDGVVESVDLIGFIGGGNLFGMSLRTSGAGTYQGYIDVHAGLDTAEIIGATYRFRYTAP